MDIAVTYELNEYVTRERDEDDSWDIGDSAASPEVFSTHILDKDNKYNLSRCYSNVELIGEAKHGDMVHVVWAHYSTGCTFGSNETIDIVGVFSDHEDAIDVADAATDLKNAHSFKVDTKFGEKDFYAPWIGYFEHLNAIHIESFRLEK